MIFGGPQGFAGFFIQAASMPHSVKIIEDLGVVMARFRSEVSYEEVRNVLDEAVQLPGFRPHLKAIIDFRNATTHATGTDVHKLALYAQNTDLAWGDTKWAVIAPSDLIYGLSRMYSALTSGYEVTTRVFRSAEEADDWLGLGMEMEEILARAVA